MARTVLLNLLGTDNTSRAFRSAAREADRTADSVDRADRSAQNADDSHGRLTSTLSRLAPAAGQAAASIGMAAAQLGAAVPAAASLVSTLVAIAPAAAVAATAITAGALAMGAFKIGMIGVGDAVKAALDPSNPEAYAAALKKLSPNARAFVEQLHQMQPAFAGLKAAVQDNLFQGLDKSFANAARTTLPIFREGLVGAAQALNGMGKNLLSTIQGLGKSGALKSLFDGANAGLSNLTKIPAQILKGFVQLGAAAAPTFARMTAGIGNLATRASNALSGAFKSGAMSQAINIAVGLLKQLGQVAVNVFKIVSNIFGAAQASGGGLIGTLQKITAALAGVTANPAFQAGLRAIFGVMSQLATTAAPLLAQALLAIAPVFTALGPPLQALIQALGQALQPVIAALGPVLVAAAQAVGALVVALAPLLPVIGQVIAALLPVLVPVLQLLTTVLTALTPVIAFVANALTTYLVPVITAVVGVVTTVVNWFKTLVEQTFPAVVAAVSGAGGPLAGLKQALSDLWAAVGPLITALGNLAKDLLEKLKPAIDPIQEAVKNLAEAFTVVLTDAIKNIAIPAIKGLTELLDGDADKALKGYAAAAKDAATSIVESMASLPEKTGPVVMQWAVKVGLAVKGMSDAAQKAVADMSDKVVQQFFTMARRLPGAFTGAIGAMRTAGRALLKGLVAGLEIVAPELLILGRKWIKGFSALFAAARPAMVAIGRSLIQGLVDGITSVIGKVKSTLQGITNMIPDWKGPPAKDRALLTPSGVMIMEGLNDGIETGWKLTRNALKRITGELQDDVHKVAGTLGRATYDVAIITIGEKLQKALKGTADQINDATKQIAEKIRAAFKAKDITADQRDGLLDYLSNTNKKLRDLSKEREKILDKIKEIQDYAKQLTQTVLNYANITNIKGEGDATPNGAQLVAGLQARLATIRQFGGNLKKLAQAGLSKAILGQILDAGIDGGAAIAAELANGPASIIAALNTAQTQITKIAKGIGLDGADALFGSGKAMGDAFLKGLKAMEKALTDSMELLVEKLLKALGKGVDGAKAKLADLTLAANQLKNLTDATYDYNPQAKGAVVAPKAPAAAPKPLPSYQYLPAAPTKSSGAKAVTVNFGGVTVKDRVSVDMLMAASSFAARSATF